jgi:hypothetical protein
MKLNCGGKKPPRNLIQNITVQAQPRCINSHTFAPNITIKSSPTWQKVVDPCEGYFLNTGPERGEEMRMKFPGKRTQTFKKEEAHLRVFHLHFQKKSISKNYTYPRKWLTKRWFVYWATQGHISE